MGDDRWWQRAVIYEIYPRSFQDSNGDGVGDLGGLRARLPYLQWLGIDAIWITPINASPMADFGYDVSDYCAIDALFGSLADFDAMLADAHRLSIRVILDLVPNHTSEHHPWFRESRSSLRSPKRAWYIWREGKVDGGPPNNWLSNFGGSAWQWDEPTGQFYLHSFLKEQPDLNWRNAEVRAAMHDVLRFWLKRGVDGFRVDVIWLLIKDAAFRDNPVNPSYAEGRPSIERLVQVHSADQTDVHEVIAEMRGVLAEFGGDRILIGEIYLPLERLMAYYGANLSGAHLPFNFQLLHTTWNARRLAQLIAEYESALPPGGWPNWVLGNHDKPRIAARVGDSQARVAAMLLLTLRGTPTMYYGDEIGLAHVPIPPEVVQDPWERNEPGLAVGRDPERTPMQWQNTAGAGFTDGVPWLPFSADWQERNVRRMAEDPRSILTLYRQLIALRRGSIVLQAGRYQRVETDADVLTYCRQLGADCVTVFLNLGAETREIAPGAGGRILLSTHLDREGHCDAFSQLRPHEGLVVATPAAVLPSSPAQPV